MSRGLEVGIKQLRKVKEKKESRNNKTNQREKKKKKKMWKDEMGIQGRNAELLLHGVVEKDTLLSKARAARKHFNHNSRSK